MKVERNSQCPCGSGKKYKKCCLLKADAGSTGTSPVEVKSSFEIYNSEYTLASVAGLTLLSGNHGKNFRLEQIVADILVAYNQNPVNISDQDLKSVLDSQYPSSYMEDEPVNLFSDLVAFHGGNYTFFPGITESSSFIVSTMLRMMFLHQNKDLPKEFLERCLQSSKLILELSNNMARKLNIERYQPGQVSSGKISFPNSVKLTQLRAAVTITEQQMSTLKAAFRINDDVLDSFLIAATDPTLVGRYGEESLLAAKPIFKTESGYIIASPATLTFALVEFVRGEAERMGCLDLVRQKFHDQVWEDLQLNLKVLGFKYIDMKGRGLNLFPESLGALYKFDDNKIAYIHIETANQTMQHAKKITGSSVLEEVLKLEDFVGFETMEIAISSSLGEMFMLSHSGNKVGRTLLMQASEFEVLSGLKNVNAIGLYKFSGANEKVSKGRPSLDSFLDRFQLYRENKESFYLSDEVSDIVPLIEPGYGESLFAESKLTKDIHSVETRLDGQPVLLNVRRKDKYAPVYVCETGLVEGNLAMLVEGYFQPLWISPLNIPPKGKEVRKMYFEVADAIAYWMWQVQDHLFQYLKPLGPDPLFIDFELLDPDKWVDIERNKAVNPDVGKHFQLLILGGRITIGIPSALLPYLYRADNQGDRILVEAMIGGVNVLLKDKGLPEITEAQLKEIVTVNAPLGLKKKFFLIDSANNLMIDERNLEGFRYVEEHDVSGVLDQIGPLLGQGAPKVGVLKSKEEKEQFLSSVTQKALLPLLRTKLSQYNSSELLKRLLILNEGLIHKRENLKILTPTRIACYVGEKQQQKDLLKEVGKLNEATVSVRCLIEHISAEPYNGGTPTSHTAVDELMAIMSQIISTGTVSDLIHFEFLDMEIGMLPTGRMGSDKAVMRNIYDPFHEAKAKENVTDAIETFDRAFAVESADEAKPLPQALEKAFMADFGISLSRLFEFMDAMIHIAFNQLSAAAEFPLDELQREINTLVEPFDEAEFESAIACLSLFERGKVEKLPKEGGFEFIDIMPWRFNRMLSLMRRPLIISGNKGSEVVNWGPRQAVQSKIYLIDQLISGRFRNPIGSEVAKAIGKFAAERGDALVKGVLKAIDPTDLIIDHDVYIRDSAPFFYHTDIGDIDILIIDLKNHVVYSLECKSMSPSRNGKEMVEELSKLFSGDDAWVDKHIKRDEWLKANLDKVGKEYGVDLSGFEVKSFFVTDEEMVAPHVKKGLLPMPFITLYTIEREGVKALRNDYSHQVKK